jgi:hypothetical protein
MVILLK